MTASNSTPGLMDRLYARARKGMNKVFPAHWSFLFGELALFSFGMLVLTGLYLVLFYDASAETVTYTGSYVALQGAEVSQAFHSVMDITFERRFGWVIRQTHHWAALVFIAVIVFHAGRVFFTGAFRRPRRLNWMLGVTLMGLAMVTGFFGFVLPHDLLAGTSARIGHALAVSVPLVGPGVADLLFAGPFGNPAMLHRAWLLHVIILPVLIAVNLLGHLGLVWVQTHTQYPAATPDEDTVEGASAWPAYTIKTLGLALLVAGVLVALGSLVEIEPLWTYGPFDEASSTVPAQPDWYLGWVEGALRIVPSVGFRIGAFLIPSPFLVGVVLPVGVFLVLFAWPLVEERRVGDRSSHHLLDRPRHRPVRTSLGVAGLTALAVLLLAGSHDLQAYLLQVPLESMTVVYRVLLLVAPPVAGGITYFACRALAREEAPYA